MKTSNITFFIGVFLLMYSTAFSQGEALFKQKCNTCHLFDRASTGPRLQGVKQKWDDAGEAELLYQWVKNSPALIASGQSKMALAIKNFNPNEMPPQTVTNEEIDAILTYLDAPPVIDTTQTITAPLTQDATDYEGNLVLFYWLFGLMILLIFVILIMTNTIISFVRSDFFKHRLKQPQNRKPVPGMLILAITFGCIALNNPGYALQVLETGTETEKTPWLLVERFDLILLLAVDIALIFVVLYLRGMFNAFLRMASNKSL